MSKKLRVLLTGATGTMGQTAAQSLLREEGLVLRFFSLDTPQDRRILNNLAEFGTFETQFGDLTNYEDVTKAVREVDLILHLAALVSPTADEHPELAMKINYGSTVNLLRAINKSVRFVYIGTVAQTGDRRPPVHWGRVGDPIQPSVFDYYAVSKIAAEREVIESGLDRWVSLRQTGIIGPAMTEINTPIILHNPLNNVLEYISDRDSAVLLRNLVTSVRDKTLPEEFWSHIYNIGGGEACRADSIRLYESVFAKIGVDSLDGAFPPPWLATQNFHGQYYLDSDKLENYLHFRNDSLEYFYEAYDKTFGFLGTFGRAICKLPFGQSLLKFFVRLRFKRLAHAPRGTLTAIEENNQVFIQAFWGSKEAWESLPQDLADYHPVRDTIEALPIDHGYDESKPASELSLADVRQAANFRGGSCLSESMETGNWREKLQFRCGFGHTFTASPKLILEGGHWCPHCEEYSWNYAERAKIDPFFAQVWTPLHPHPETETIKEVRSTDVSFAEPGTSSE